MDRKKLLTLASVIALLACGACFLPPPPRPQIHPRGIRSVLVNVADITAQPLVDKDAFGRSIAEAINRQTQGHGPRARFGTEQSPNAEPDAVLQVYIVSETAASQPVSPVASDWSLTLTMNATLTAANGVSLDQLPDRQLHWSGRLSVSTPDLAWRDPIVRSWLNEVANQIAVDLMYGVHAVQ